jgi:hypothetical protein
MNHFDLSSGSMDVFCKLIGDYVHKLFRQMRILKNLNNPDEGYFPEYFSLYYSGFCVQHGYKSISAALSGSIN